MLNSDTKRKIQSARDVLVGKIPVPSQQVEQITLAMIYKFMSDMDSQAEELGDHTGFFKDEFEKYNWTNIIDISLSAYDRVALYSEGLERMGSNPNVPQLFRDMFKGAYLPFKDPEILKLFLQQINELAYDHSEDLGDAFEFLLSVLGSQGDAGQFRTPRHIIDFIVDVVDPLKTDRILDPACGTAGFLISAYKHILKENTLPSGRLGSALTSDEKNRLTSNVNGYDISSDMRRLSLVNLYLHQFPDPRVYEYDTLTSLDRWDDEFDCILANPPFMTPKGGIKPHNRFSVQANRAEVLFVDYIMEHLSTTGKAGIVVPEGIIFTSGNAYKQLRKLLVDEGYLWAVVSLPSGVFNPYSGVKTSILLIDKAIAKKAQSIMFVKINDDGFDLGAQRKEKGIGELPMAVEALKAYKKYILDNGEIDITGWPTVLQEVDGSPLCQFAKKTEIAKSGDYNLSGNRYEIQEERQTSDWPLVKLSEVCEIVGGGTPSRTNEKYWNGEIPWLTCKYIEDNQTISGFETITEKGLKESSSRQIAIGSTIVVTRVSVGKFAFADKSYAINQDLTALTPKTELLNNRYLLYMGKELANAIKQNATGIGVTGVTREFVQNFEIPLPPLSVQLDLVTELDRYQRIIDGAQAVIDNWKPEIEIDPEWETLKIQAVCEINPKKVIPENINDNTLLDFAPMESISEKTNDITYQKRTYGEVKKGYTYFAENDVVLAKVTPCFENGKSAIITGLKEGIGFGTTELIVLRPNNRILPAFLYYWISKPDFIQKGKSHLTGTGGLKRVTKEYVMGYQISVPTIEVQSTIVAEFQKQESALKSLHILIETTKNLQTRLLNNITG